MFGVVVASLLAWESVVFSFVPHDDVPWEVPVFCSGLLSEAILEDLAALSTGVIDAVLDAAVMIVML